VTPRIHFALALVSALFLSSCDREPEVGSPEWCEAESQDGRMDDYTMTDVSRYAKHCMFAREEQ